MMEETGYSISPPLSYADREDPEAHSANFGPVVREPIQIRDMVGDDRTEAGHVEMQQPKQEHLEAEAKLQPKRDRGKEFRSIVRFSGNRGRRAVQSL